MNHSFKVFVVILIFGFTSCKSSKAIVASGEASSKLSAKQVIKQHQTNATDFKTLKGKLKAKLTQNKKEQGATFNFRIEKDKVIWINEAILGLARLKITPEKVQFYSKIDKHYFDGNYDLLSDVVGINLDFTKVQNILLGEALFNLDDVPHRVKINENQYQLAPKKQSNLLALFYMIHPSHFKMNRQEFYQKLKNRQLQINYTSYQDVESKVLPKAIKIIGVEDTDEVIIDLEFKSVKLNEELRFPFKIPSGFNAIEVKP